MGEHLGMIDNCSLLKIVHDFRLASKRCLGRHGKALAGFTSSTQGNHWKKKEEEQNWKEIKIILIYTKLKTNGRA